MATMLLLIASVEKVPTEKAAMMASMVTAAKEAMMHLTVRAKRTQEKVAMMVTKAASKATMVSTRDSMGATRDTKARIGSGADLRPVWLQERNCCFSDYECCCVCSHFHIPFVTMLGLFVR